jgi:hypothetical protein
MTFIKNLLESWKMAYRQYKRKKNKSDPFIY